MWYQVSTATTKWLPSDHSDYQSDYQVANATTQMTIKWPPRLPNDYHGRGTIFFVLLAKRLSLHTANLSRCCCWCYHNSSASRQILLQGRDISTNPGPIAKATKCENCEKTIKKNQKSAICGVCFGQSHAKCTGLNLKYVTIGWTWPKCLISVVPFNKCSTADLLGLSNEEPDLVDSAEHEKMSQNAQQALLNQPKKLRVLHINTQSMIKRNSKDADRLKSANTRSGFSNC